MSELPNPSVPQSIGQRFEERRIRMDLSGDTDLFGRRVLERRLVAEDPAGVMRSDKRGDILVHSHGPFSGDPPAALVEEPLHAVHSDDEPCVICGQHRVDGGRRRVLEGRIYSGIETGEKEWSPHLDAPPSDVVGSAGRDPRYGSVNDDESVERFRSGDGDPYGGIPQALGNLVCAGIEGRRLRTSLVNEEGSDREIDGLARIVRMEGEHLRSRGLP
jgi:hypothetical protein